MFDNAIIRPWIVFSKKLAFVNELGQARTKGQLISEQIYAVLDFPKMQ